MSVFKLQIDVDALTIGHMRGELSRILKEAARDMRGEAWSVILAEGVPLFDVDGNRVGFYRIEEDK